MNAKKAKYLRKLLIDNEFKTKLPYLKVIVQTKNTRGIVRDEEHFLQVKYLKKCWLKASVLEKPKFIILITTGGFK